MLLPDLAHAGFFSSFAFFVARALAILLTFAAIAGCQVAQRASPPLDAGTSSAVSRPATTAERLEAVGRAREAYGEQSAQVADALMELGLHYREMALYDEARATYQLATTMRERLFGPTSPMVANASIELGALENDSGRYMAAEELFRRGLHLL